MSNTYYCSVCNAYHIEGVELTDKHKKEVAVRNENAQLRATIEELTEKLELLQGDK